MAPDRNSARAQALLRAHAERQRFTPFAGDWALGSLDEAYVVQGLFVAALLAEQQTGVAGYKIGLTSQRMQALCGIGSPIAGVVLGNRVHRSGLCFQRSQYGRLGLEFEIAVRLGRDLPAAAAPYDFAQVAGAVDAVCPAFEVVDDRAADYSQLDMLSLVADNSWNAGVVLGEFHRSWPELPSLQGVVYRNGEELDRGTGGDVLGHPFAALTWLANHLARAQGGLRAGDIVATGTLVPTRFPAGPEAYVFELAGLGQVAVSVCD